MLRALFLLFVGAVVAVCLVPLHGRTLLERADQNGLPAAAAEAVRSALDRFGGATRGHRKSPAARRAGTEPGERVVEARPKERLSAGDRASLDHLVRSRAR
jgi:hypothetical protein